MQIRILSSQCHRSDTPLDHLKATMVSASTLDLDHCGAFPLFITSLCPCQSRAVKTLTFSRHPSDIKLAVAFRRHRGGFRRSGSAFVALSGDGVKSDGGWRSDEKTVEGSQDLAIDQLRKRVVFGLGLGLGIAAGGIVVTRGWAFTTSLAAAVFVQCLLRPRNTLSL